VAGTVISLLGAVVLSVNAEPLIRMMSLPARFAAVLGWSWHFAR